ncbi:MAG: hypothetical protein DRQ43_09265 [Gammaproteobacteria bacterium]|nr:MAG: hypothetical protein DRQ43_09265 [Gammaproteobacteria bacterium]
MKLLKKVLETRFTFLAYYTLLKAKEEDGLYIKTKNNKRIYVESSTDFFQVTQMLEENLPTHYLQHRFAEDIGVTL